MLARHAEQVTSKASQSVGPSAPILLEVSAIPHHVPLGHNPNCTFCWKMAKEEI